MDISGPLQAFSDSRFVNGRPAYQVTLASEMGGPIVTDSGVKVETVRLDRAVLGSVDTLLVAGGNLAIRSVATESLQAKLAKYLDRPRRLGSICTGAFVLAALVLVASPAAAQGGFDLRRSARREKPLAPDELEGGDHGVAVFGGVGRLHG